jgi:hypothetical protein
VTPKEFPGHLSPLQFDILRAFRSRDFFLTGGGALIGFYGHKRTTRDLDLFTRDEDAFREGVNALGDTAALVGGDLESLRTSPYFRRFRVTRGEEETLVDLVWETVKAVSEPTELEPYFILIDTPQELCVNKICAVVGRAESRDLVDLRFLESQGLNLDEAISRAPEKDHGVGKDTLLMALQGISSVQLDPETEDFRSKWMEKLKLDLLPPQS